MVKGRCVWRVEVGVDVLGVGNITSALGLLAISPAQTSLKTNKSQGTAV